IAMGELLTALDAFPQATVILTYPNADTGGRVLIEQIDQWVNSNQHRAKAFVSLGQQRYLSLMREANVIVGNSSSGITEAPALKKATVNIGDRQKGRLKAKSIIDVSEDSTSIMDAIHQALSPKFQSLLPSVQSWYGSGNVSYKIKETLKTFTPQTQKSFFDIDHV
ncbi:UDP-N-acetylglucosamine 2-epimerase (hydrolyzing), partial [Cylindrospermopsis raciborskii S07]